MSYYLSRTINAAFDEVVPRVIAALKEEGFGILTDIDVQATLKTKLGADMPSYRILGACNPSFAHQALQIEDRLGVLLPCNDPVTSMDRTDNPKLAAVAGEVRVRLLHAVEHA